MNRLGQVPAKGLPDFRCSLLGLPPIDSRRLALEPAQELTAVSAICLLWVCYLVFKDRAACQRLPCCATVCFASPLPAAGRLLYSEPFQLSSDRCRFAVSVHREGELLFSFVGARNLLPFRLPCQLASSTRFFRSTDSVACATFSASAGGGFYHHRVSSQLRFVDLLFRPVCCTGRRSPPPMRFRLSRPRGAASIASPSWESTAHCRRAAVPTCPLHVQSEVTSRLPTNRRPADVSPRGEGPYPPSDQPAQALFPKTRVGPSPRRSCGHQGPERSNRSLDRSTRP